MIAVDKITKAYGKVTAVEEISFEIPRGQVVGLLGLNGAGKSTTMNIITGCLSADGGQVLIDGIDIAKAPQIAKRKIGYLPEIPPLYTDMKVCEYLNFVYDLKQLKLPRKEHIAKCAQLVGLEIMLSRLIGNLSKGYKQRVGFAAALIGEPELLILDEPTVGLDPSQMIEIRNLIKELGKTKTVILSSHILSEVQAVCERIIVINKGSVVADDSAKELEMAMRDNLEYTIEVWGNDLKIIKCLESIAALWAIKVVGKIGEQVTISVMGAGDIMVRKEISKRLASESLAVTTMQPNELSLEDVFLKLVTKQEEGR